MDTNRMAATQLPHTLPHAARTANPLAAAEMDLRRAKCLFCLVVEQNQRMQTLLRHAREAFHQARENWERLIVLNESAAE